MLLARVYVKTVSLIMEPILVEVQQSRVRRLAIISVHGWHMETAHQMTLALLSADQ